MLSVAIRVNTWSLYYEVLDRMLVSEHSFTLVRLNLNMSYSCKQCSSEETNWSGSALFVIKYVNLNQQSGSSNLIGWKLEMGMAS